MGFLNPWLLLGLAGVAIPIIIHLLNRFRRRRIDWAAMELLRRAMMMRSRQVRLEDLILLALRCLAIILIALALARPTIRSSGAKWFGAGEQIGAIIALDGSFSMETRPGVQSRFGRAVALVNASDPPLIVVRPRPPGDAHRRLRTSGQRPATSGRSGNRPTG